MADGDIVRKITISATGENIDSTKTSVEALGAATTALMALTDEAAKRATDAEKAYSGQANALDADTESHRTFGGVMKTAAEYTLEAAAAYYAHGAAIQVALAATRLLVGVLFEIYLAYKIVTGVIGLVSDAWRLGGEELKKYTDLATNAAGNSVEFFQRIAKAATDAKLPLDAFTASMKTLNDSTAGKLGGSDAQVKLTSLVKDGENFSGNTGVALLQNANGAEEKLRAVASLYDQAVKSGERLAGLDLVKTVLGDTVAQNLAKDSGYLDKMLKAADAIAADTLISSADVANAVELQTRLDAAEKILSERWHPIQNILVQLGIQMREAWVNIVEQIAHAVDWAAKLISKLGDAPSWFQNKLNQGATAFMELTTTPESRKAAEASYGISSDPIDIASQASENQRGSAQFAAQMKDARQRLAEGMNRKFDTSGDPNKDDKTADTSAYDRATEALLKYVQVTKAAALTVSDNVGQQEKFKAIAQLTAGALKDGTPITAALTAEMTKLAEKAGAAALALEKAKINSSISFGSKTSLLSPEDVSIANQLKGIYPDVATALNSIEAAGIRTNTALSGLSSTFSGTMTTGLTDILDGTKSAGQGFADMSKIIVRAIEEMIVKMLVVQPLMRALQSSFGGFSLGGGPTLNSDPWSFPKFANGTDNAPGGWSLVGEQGPEFVNLPKGSQVLPNGQMPGGASVHAPVTVQIDATGADAAGLARVQQQIASLQATLPSTIVATVQKAKTNRVL